MKSPQNAAFTSPLLSPRASVASNNPKKKVVKTAAKYPKESELDRQLREAKEEAERYKMQELERYKMIEAEKARIAAQKMRKKEKELKEYEKMLRDKQLQDQLDAEQKRLEREAFDRQ